jgi:hypothetical protein
LPFFLSYPLFFINKGLILKLNLKVKRKVSIVPFEKHDQVVYYTIRFAGEEDTEFDKFFDKYDIDEFGEDFDIITEWLYKIGEEGAIERFFRPEGGRIGAIPVETNRLRLYCLRINECVVILGNGGEKTTRSYQEDPELNEYVQALRETEKHLMARMSSANPRASMYNCQLFGNLDFEIEITPETENEEKK